MLFPKKSKALACAQADEFSCSKDDTAQARNQAQTLISNIANLTQDILQNLPKKI
jgi:hypothetical protein